MPGTVTYPPASDHTVLHLPFNLQTFTSPEPFFPIIFNVLKHSSTKSFTVLCSTPLSDHDGAQLYDILRRNPRENWKGMQRFLGGVYATLAAAQWACGRVLMDVEVAFDRSAGSPRGLWQESSGSTQTIAFEGSDELLPSTRAALPPVTATIPCPVCHTPSQNLNLDLVSGPSTSALGGTFDHLHAAHKLLLHLSLFLSTHKLIVGLMSDSLLSSKSNSSLVQPLSERIAAVESFLSRCGARKPGEEGEGVIMDVVEIHDAFGPTAWDADIDGLVVSTETFSGGEMVNVLRRDKGLRELELFVIDVIASDLVNDDGEEKGITTQGSESVKTVDLSEEKDEKRLKELKMGSTAIRQWLKEREKAKGVE